MFIVTHFGCNSTAGDMWIPSSRFFTDYEEAHQHFLSLAPNLEDPDNEAEREFTPRCVNNHPSYTVLEVRRQLGGYNDGAWHRAKRPEGVLIARVIVDAPKAE